MCPQECSFQCSDRDATITATVNRLLENLQKHGAVDGVVIVGSASTGNVTPDSDLDLVIVLSSSPVRLDVGITEVDGTVTDLLFVYAEELNEIATWSEPDAPTPRQAQIACWLTSGEIVLDRHGRLDVLARQLRNTDLPLAKGDSEKRRIVFSINFNLIHNRRMFRSPSKLYQEALDLRLLYCVSDLMTGYFTLRDLSWRGEKHAVEHWERDDPAYLRLYREFVAAQGLRQRSAIYERLVELTLEPCGGERNAGDTHIQPGNKEQWDEEIDGALRKFWRSISGET